MLTDRPRFDSGAAGYSVVWQNGQCWVGLKTHMGYNQEAYDAEIAALASTENCYHAADGPESTSSKTKIAPTGRSSVDACVWCCVRGLDTIRFR